MVSCAPRLKQLTHPFFYWSSSFWGRKLLPNCCRFIHFIYIINKVLENNVTYSLTVKEIWRCFTTKIFKFFWGSISSAVLLFTWELYIYFNIKTMHVGGVLVCHLFKLSANILSLFTVETYLTATSLLQPLYSGLNQSSVSHFRI